MRISKIFFILILVSVSFSIVIADTPGIAIRVLSSEITSDKIYSSVNNVFIESLIRVYDRQTGTLLQELEMGEDIIPDLHIYENNLYIFSHDGNFSVYSTDPELSLTNSVRASNGSITFSWIDDDNIYTYDTWKKAIVWDRNDYSIVKKLEEVDGFRFMFSSDDEMFYGASSDGILRIWDKSDWSVIASESINSTSDGNMTFLQAFYFDGEFIYTVLNDGRWTDRSLIKIWNKTNLEVQGSFTIDKIIDSLVSDSANIYLLSKITGEIFVYNKQDLNLDHTIVYEPIEILSHIKLYDNLLFVSSQNGTIKTWSTSDFSMMSNIGEPLHLDLPTDYVEGIAMNPLPIFLIIIIISLINIFLPDKFSGNLKKRFETVNINDVLSIVIIAGVIMLGVAMIRPTMISGIYSGYVAIPQYFDVFVRKGAFSYYWFVLWPMIGYWLARKRGNKTASTVSIIFSVIAYALFFLIP